MQARVFVAQPIYGAVPAEAAMSFARLLVSGTMRGIISGYGQTHFSGLSIARNRLVRQAIEGNHTHILFVDADMVLPPNTIARLLLHRVPVVTGLYFQRVPPHNPVVMTLGDLAQPVEAYSPGLSKVGAIGMGCALIEVGALRKLKEHFGDERWFDYENNEGEDVFFSRRCEKSDVPIYLDADCKCGHIGETVFTEEHYLTYKPTV